MNRTLLRTGLLVSLGITMLSAEAALAGHGQAPHTERVDCAQGKTLSQALDMHPRPLIVEFTGTCTGDITIPGDDITLRGADASATVVGTITIEGHSRVTLEDLTVRDVPPGSAITRIGHGIVVASGQGITLRKLNVVNAGNIGIDIESSTVHMTDCTITRSRRHGLSVSFGAVLDVRGSLSVDQSGLIGIVVTDEAQIQMSSMSQVSTIDNLGGGLVIQLQSHVTVHGGTHLMVSRNGSGIAVVDDGSIIYGPVTIDVIGNRGFGVQVGQLADWTLFPGVLPNLTIADNLGPGFLVIRNAFVRLRENTTITGNAGPGLVVDEAGVAIRGTTIQNNNPAGDVFLAFGAKATFDGGNTFGTPIVCDGTVIARGQFLCPSTSTVTNEQRLQFERLFMGAASALP